MDTPCQEKQRLLRLYASAIEDDTQALKDYAKTINDGLGGDVLESLRERLKESHRNCREIRKRFTAHVTEHGCGTPDRDLETRTGSAETE